MNDLPTLRRRGIGFAALALGLLALSVGASAAIAADAPTIAQATATVQLPTATLTPIGGPTATPTRTPTITPVLAEIIGTPTRLRTGPGLDFDIVAELEAGTILPVVGRSVRLPWLVVEWQDAPDGRAWVFKDLVIIIGDLSTVPIVDEPELPTIDPTLAIIQATATVLLQTPGAAETATVTALFLPTGIYTQTPGGPGVAMGGALPTFTEPAPYNPPLTLQARANNSPHERGGLPPAVLIIALGAIGLLALVLGLLRRL